VVRRYNIHAVSPYEKIVLIHRLCSARTYSCNCLTAITKYYHIILYKPTYEIISLNNKRSRRVFARPPFCDVHDGGWPELGANNIRARVVHGNCVHAINIICNIIPPRVAKKVHDAHTTNSVCILKMYIIFIVFIYAEYRITVMCGYNIIL